MSSPVEIKSETMYSVKNYGSGMTPFYTNLALWVGGLILVSIFKQEVDKDDEVHHFSPTSAYMGRWLLYAAVGLVQGCIVCIGDIILLGVQCVHPLLFIIAGMFCSFVYVSLIYAMAITLKHIGKALCVLFIILQIPGSSFNSSSRIRTFNITERFPFSFTPVSVSHNIKSVSASFLSNKWLRFISSGRSTSPIKKAIGINIARISRFFI